MTFPEVQPSSMFKKVKNWVTGSGSTEKTMPTHFQAQTESLKMFLSIPEELLKNLELNESFQEFVRRIFSIYTQIRCQDIFYYKRHGEWLTTGISMVSIC